MKSRLWSFLVTLALVTSLVVLAPPFVNVANAIAGISPAAPTNDVVGAPVSVTGTVTAASTYQVRWDSATGPIMTLVGGGSATGVSGTGTVNVNVVVPDAVGGAHNIFLLQTTGLGAGTNASTPFTVNTNLVLLDPSDAAEATALVNGPPVTTLVKVKGTGYATAETVAVDFDATTFLPNITLTAGAKGTWRKTITVPARPGAAYTVSGTGTVTGAITASFLVDPSLTVNPPTGWSGKTGVSLVGRGYQVGDAVTVTFDAAPLTTSVIPAVPATGTWSATFTVPAAAPGAHTIAATGTATLPVNATFNTPDIVLTPGTGGTGQAVSVAGTGFQPSEASIRINFDGVAMLTTPSAVVADTAGAWNATFVLPASAVLGAHVNPLGVDAYGASTPVTTVPNQTYTVVAGIGINPATGPVGTVVTVTGKYFVVGDGTIDVTLDGVRVVGPIPNSTGVWTRTFSIPAAQSGVAHVVDAPTLGGVTVMASPPTFDVTPAITLSPSAGPGGTVVTVYGTGFQATDANTIALTWDTSTDLTPTMVPNPVPVDANGSWTAQFTVPAGVTGGTHTVAAAGGTTTTPATASYSGISLAITPATGPVGTTVTTTGTGFGASETGIAVTWDGTVVSGTVTAGTAGTWTTTFPVPTASSGTHTVDARGATTLAATVPDQTFTVTPSLTVSATTGRPGDSVTITGNGFGTSETGIKVTWDGADLPVVYAADAFGYWTAAITLPPAATGVHQVNAYGSTTVVGLLSNVSLSIAPQLTMSPISGSAGTAVTVWGSGFYASETGIQVLFNSAGVATGITADALGSWTRTFNVPGVGRGSHTVTASGAITTTYQVPAQTFTVSGSMSISPTSGNVGKVITVTGNGFVPSAAVTVTYDGTAVTTTPSPLVSSSTGTINGTFKVPARAPGAHTVAVTDSLGALSTAFTSVTPAMSIDPISGYAGKTVTVTGTNFAASATVTITYDGTAVTTTPSPLTSSADGALSATFVAPSSGPGAHTVVVNDGATTANATFTVTSSVSASATSGAVGAQNTVSGLGFPPNSAVTFTFDNTPLVVSGSVVTDANGAFSANVTVPEAARGTHTVKATAGSATLTLNFDVTPKAAISASTGVVGDTLTLSGKGFGANQPMTFSIDNTYKLDTTPATVTSSATGSYSATISMPALAGGSHTITVSDQAVSQQLTVTITPKVVTSATSAKVGDTVNAVGTGFPSKAAITVTVSNTLATTNPSPAVADANGVFRIDVTIPPVAGGNRSLSFSGGGTNAPAEVSVTVAPAFSISPGNGNVGSQVTISGTGYPASSPVTVTYEGAALQTNPSALTSNAQGSFQATVTIPKSLHGQHALAAGATGASPISATFTMESAPPAAPSPVTPAMESRLGSFGSQSVAFTWLPVTDPSGVTYSLQVSKDQTFASPVLSKSGLTAATYSTAAAEKLAPKTYYWRVKAVDGASNESSWSQAFTLKVGMLPSWMPLWLFIVLIVVVLGLIAGVVYLLAFSKKKKYI